MLKFLKENKYSLILALLTFVLAGVAMWTAYRLYQLRREPITPVAPGDSGATGLENDIEACQVLVIPLSSPQESPTTSASPSISPSSSPSTSPSASPSLSPSPTATATASPDVISCDSKCSTDSDCQAVNSNWVCYSATLTCRNIDYPQANDCQRPPDSTASPTASSTSSPASVTTSSPVAQNTSVATSTPNTLPDAGTSGPTIIAVSMAIILLLGSLVLAL